MADFSKCPGRKLPDGGLLGICIACKRRTAESGPRQSWMKPPAEQDQRLVWHCEKRLDQA